MLLAIIVFISAANLALGFGLCIYMDRFESDDTSDDDADDAEQESGVAAKVERVHKDAAVEDIPSEWLESLAENAIEAQSFVEASVEVLRLEVGRYRAALVDLESQIRDCSSNPEPEELTRLVGEIQKLNTAWLEKQATAASHLQDRKEDLGGFSEIGNGLEDILLEQAAQIETTVSNLDVMDFSTDIDRGCHRLLMETCRLVDLAHQLRDGMQQSMMEIMKADDRLGSVDRRTLEDGHTQLRNRMGLELLFEDWWKNDRIRAKTVSIALLDIDRFAKINETLGTRAGDRVLTAAAQFLKENAREDTPVCRFGSETFVVYMSDTGPRNAMSLAERLRQTLSESVFEYNDRELELTLSATVTEVLHEDTTATLFARLKKGLRMAKSHGRNCTSLDEGEGATVVAPPEFKVKSHVIRVFDDDA